MGKRNKKIITVAAVLLAVATAAIIGTIAIQATPANRVKRQLRLAQKYLNEMNYEQAVLAYKEAIAIDPKCEEAYLAIADIYIKTGQEEAAVRILEEAKNNIQTEKIKIKLDEARKKADDVKQAREPADKADGNESKVPVQKPSEVPTQKPTEMLPEETQAPTSSVVRQSTQAESKETETVSLQPVTETATQPTVIKPTETVTRAAIEAASDDTGEAEDTDTGSAGEGDIILFGNYEQDNNPDNGAEPIEWQVLSRQDGRMLVISRYGLDCQRYNETYANVTWETCTLRNWLNTEFYNIAFSAGEKELIVTTALDNPDNAVYGTAGGSVTDDNVFCLSIDEAKTYFAGQSGSAEPTQYAVSKGAYANTSTQWSGGSCYYWLRSPGNAQDFASIISINGNTDSYGYLVYSSPEAVRPAMWLTISQ